MMTDVHPLKLVQVNRSTFVTMNQEYRIQHTPFRGGKSAWIISVKEGNWMKALDHAQTLPEARAKFIQMMVAA